MCEAFTEQHATDFVVRGPSHPHCIGYWREISVKAKQFHSRVAFTWLGDIVEFFLVDVNSLGGHYLEIISRDASVASSKDVCSAGVPDAASDIRDIWCEPAGFGLADDGNG